MKKVLIGAAVLAMFATGCQDEIFVNEVKSAGKGEFFTLEVGKGFESRTVLSGSATHWCEDDAIFVSGAGGKVSGVLNFNGYVGSDKSQAKFSGWISGGQPSELQHIVFPVPQGGKIDMAKRNPGKLDAPMIGTIGNGAVQTLNNVGGLLAVMVDEEGSNGLKLKATADGGNNMTGGYYTFSDGKLTYTPVDSPVSIQTSEDGFAYIPVATTTDPTDGTENNQSVSVNVVILNNNNVNIVETDNLLNINKNEIFGDEADEDTGLNVSVDENGESTEIVTVATLDELKSIAESAGGDFNIMFADDIVMGNNETPSEAIQFKGVTNLTIYGNNKTLTLRGKAKHRDGVIESYNCILANAPITVNNLTIVNEKLSKDGENISADREQVYTFVRGTRVTYNTVIFDGGVLVKTNETFIDCDFTESVLIKNEDGNATNGKFCMFIDHQYNSDTETEYVVNLDGCTFNASGYGCVKVAGNKGANITVNVKGCTFYNTCPRNSWSQETPKYDIKMTGDNIEVNDQGENTWSKNGNGGYGEG